jgi:hypothetical protein
VAAITVLYIPLNFLSLEMRETERVKIHILTEEDVNKLKAHNLNEGISQQQGIKYVNASLYSNKTY